MKEQKTMRRKPLMQSRTFSAGFIGGVLINSLVMLVVLASVQSVYAQQEIQEADFRYQEQDNYCGIALMQTFVPELSQDEIASELYKWKTSLTYWGDFSYFFNKHGVKYHYSSLGEEFPAIILLNGNTFGLRQNHYVLALGKKNNFYYVFDPQNGFYRKPGTYLDGSKALVIEQSNWEL
jgi:hypothetical protein